MKEVEFINSRTEQVRSQKQQQQQQHHANDYPLKAKNIGSSNAAKEKPAPPLTSEERNAVIEVLKNFTDVLAIYRSTLKDHISGKKSKENPTEENCNDMIIKFQEDGLYVSDILDDLIDDIETNGRYNVLIREIDNVRKRRDNEIAIAKDCEETLRNIDQLRKELNEEISANSREKETLRTKFLLAKNETKKMRYKVNIELKYVMAREEARRESNYLRWSNEVKNLEKTLKTISSMEKNEHRVAENIGKFLEENIIEHEKAIVKWEKRYQREMQMYENGNENLKKEINDRREALETLQFKYRERQAFIDTYIAEKEAARELEKRESDRRDCAVRIQAWWRGVMVRRKLGPYRPDEKKKKRPVKSKK